jgi:MFS family permease
MVSLVFMPLGQALAGPLANLVGTNAVLTGAAVLVVVSCAAGIATPSVRALRVPTPSPAPASDSARERPPPAQPARLP